jgi:hypothetical protein
MHSLAKAEEKIAAAQEGMKTKIPQARRINSKPSKIGSLAMKSRKETKTSSNAERRAAWAEKSETLLDGRFVLPYDRLRISTTTSRTA